MLDWRSDTMRSLNDALKVFRKLLMKITKVPNNLILNGESIRGTELVTIKNGQKVPISLDDTCIIHYINPVDTINIIEPVENDDYIQTLQSYELHLVIYGNNSHNVVNNIKANIYSEYCSNTLRDNDISLLNIESIENTSDFKINQTYVLRYDVKINFDVIIENDKTEVENEYNDFEIGGLKTI